MNKNTVIGQILFNLIGLIETRYSDGEDIGGGLYSLVETEKLESLKQIISKNFNKKGDSVTLDDCYKSVLEFSDSINSDQSDCGIPGYEFLSQEGVNGQLKVLFLEGRIATIENVKSYFIDPKSKIMIVYHNHDGPDARDSFFIQHIRAYSFKSYHNE